MSRKRSLFIMVMLVVSIALAVSLINIKPGQAATNLVGNPGFETGSLSPWTYWGTASVLNSNVHGGTYAARVGTASGATEQVVSGLTPSTAYTLTGWVKTSATSVTGLVGAKNFGGSETSQSSTSTSYTQLTVHFTTGASNTSATIYCYKSTASGYLYCDDYSLTADGGGPTATNTPVPPTATRTNTPVPPTATATSSAPYDDEFTSGTLAGKWSWVRQDSANWSLTARSGYMRITCQAGEINGTNTTGKNILLETPPAGDWTVVIKVDGKPTANWAQAGILVYQDDDNWLKVDRLYDSGNVFQLGKETGGTYTYTNVADAIASTVSYMKIVKSGSNYSDYYSADGISYTQVGTTQAITLSNIKVGLICYGGTGLTADFDYIHVTTGAQPTATNTPVPPTATRTFTPVPPTATRTNTPVPPTATRTFTPVPPTATRTNTPVPPTPTNTPVPGNLVGNPGYETGSLSPWTNTGTYSILTTNVHSGTYAAQVSSGATEQVLSGLTPGTTYQLTGWIKTSTTAVTGVIGVKEFDGNGTQNAMNSTSTTYTQLSVTFTPAAGYTSARIFCYFYTGSGYIYCDDFSVTATGPTPTPAPTPARTLVWSDEFNTGSVPNTADWVYEIGYIRNNELQYYTNSASNAYISGGSLVIKAIKDDQGYAYTSASINTSGKHSWQYGRFEMRAKLPYGKGIWPAFWGLGDSGSWPACGELDVMEMIGGGAGYDNKAYGTAHWDNGGHQSSGGSYTLPSGNFSDAYHIFAIDWTATTVTWYVDSTAYFSTDISSAGQSELRQPFDVMLNLAVGGSWPGNPDGTTVFPQYYYIDYVRIYQ